MTLVKIGEWYVNPDHIVSINEEKVDGAPDITTVILSTGDDLQIYHRSDMKAANDLQAFITRVSE